ncbi:MAG: serine hydrolase [Candidatus Eremiobacteraeota bacterium]|nr:serine hydrolase [Candidatus Eremiobacteraeota bacterium]
MPALAGVWAATQRPPAVVNQWIQPANDPWPRYAIAVSPIDETMHYFLVVSAAPDGTLRAFIRNPEANVGAFLGTRTLVAEGAALRLHATGKPDVVGSYTTDSVTLDLPGAKGTVFHRPGTAELRWFSPRPDATWAYRKPLAGTDGWPVATLAQVGMRVQPIAAEMQSIVSLRSPELTSPYVQSVAMVRHGRLVLDEYFYGFDAGRPHDVRSAGKSVTTLLVGRAIADTARFAPQTAVLSFLPQYAPFANDDARKRRMTVENLMTMSSGLACDDNDDTSPGNEDAMQNQTAQPDWYKYTLDLPIQYEPGTRAVYCSAGINLLGAIVARATGVPLEQYFYEHFAAPMQFAQYGMWLMPPPTNAAYMGGGDYFRPRDFLKFGQLFLSHGIWNGRRIIADDWLRASSVQRTIMNEDAYGEGDRYGYGWHLGTLLVAGKRYSFIDAGGNGGQLLVILPQLDMLVMVTAGNYNQYRVWKDFLTEFAGAAIRSAV